MSVNASVSQNRIGGKEQLLICSDDENATKHLDRAHNPDHKPARLKEQSKRDLTNHVS